MDVGLMNIRMSGVVWSNSDRIHCNNNWELQVSNHLLCKRARIRFKDGYDDTETIQCYESSYDYLYIKL